MNLLKEGAKNQSLDTSADNLKLNTLNSCIKCKSAEVTKMKQTFLNNKLQIENTGREFHCQVCFQKYKKKFQIRCSEFFNFTFGIFRILGLFYADVVVSSIRSRNAIAVIRFCAPLALANAYFVSELFAKTVLC